LARAAARAPRIAAIAAAEASPKASISRAIPPGYVVVAASYGPNHVLNPVGFRQSPLPAYQGLRQIAGPWTGYPLLESFHVRNFGVGTRHRGPAAVIQVTSDTEYSAPTKDQIPDYR
jgi:hypothetical protein